MIKTAISYFLILMSVATNCSPPEKKVRLSNDKDYNEYEIADPPEYDSGKESKVHTIEIRAMKFEPAVLTARKGDKVIWINQDIVDHDVTEYTARTWASSKLIPGGMWSMTVSRSELYYCNLHVVMNGKIVVDGADLSLADDSGITICK